MTTGAIAWGSDLGYPGFVHRVLKAHERDYRIVVR